MYKKKHAFYVSNMDKLLMDFDKAHPEKSAAQLKEIRKHQQGIFVDRDKPKPSTKKSKIWDKF